MKEEPTNFIYPFAGVSCVSGRTCSEGHALIRTIHVPVIQLGSIAASFSQEKDAQEYVAHCCSVKSYQSQSTRCWVEEGGLKCQGVPQSFQTWVTLPLMLVFDHEDPDNQQQGTKIIQSFKI